MCQPCIGIRLVSVIFIDSYFELILKQYSNDITIEMYKYIVIKP